MAVSGDNPISDVEDDALGREAVAARLAAELRSLDASAGAVAGVMGPWGSGKTSLVNLAKKHLAENPALPVVDFNPWMFSGAEQLVESFFTELAAQLKVRRGRLAEIASDIEAYGDLLSPLSLLPFVGGWFERLKGVAGGVRKVAERRNESVTARRADLAEKLSQLERPIVVVVDDIDRLTTAEIRDMFKLVRLTASFPNIIYVLAFDRKRVEQALSETGFSGRSFLEKIVQVGLDVPAPPKGVLVAQTAAALTKTVGDVEPQRFDPHRWPDVLAEIIAPLITNMRDVRRYAASARMTVRSMAAEVEVVDLLGLEAVRVFLPDVFEKLTVAQDELTNTSSGGLGLTRSPDDGAAVKGMLEAAGDQVEVAKAVVSRLFPAGERYVGGRHYDASWLGSWIKARRVAHPHVLKYYLEHTINEGLSAFTDAERAVAVLTEQRALDGFLRSLDRDRLDRVIAALEAWERDYPLEAVVPASTVLLKLSPELPDKPRGMLDFFDAGIIVVRVVLRLLRRIEDETGRQAAVEAILAGLHRLSAQVVLIQMAGHRQGDWDTPNDSPISACTRLRRRYVNVTTTDLNRPRTGGHTFPGVSTVAARTSAHSSTMSSLVKPVV